MKLGLTIALTIGALVATVPAAAQGYKPIEVIPPPVIHPVPVVPVTPIPNPPAPIKTYELPSAQVQATSGGGNPPQEVHEAPHVHVHSCDEHYYVCPVAYPNLYWSYELQKCRCRR